MNKKQKSKCLSKGLKTKIVYLKTRMDYSSFANFRRHPLGKKRITHGSLPTIGELQIFAPKGEEFVRGRLRRPIKFERSESVRPSAFQDMIRQAEMQDQILRQERT